MKNLILLLFLIPILSLSQDINNIDVNGYKQGNWLKKYNNGNIKYKGQFTDDKPFGLFYYFYENGKLKAEKKFFHDGQAASTHFYDKSGNLKSSGIYVNELKDSTWNYYNSDSIIIMSEQYNKGLLNVFTKTYYYD
jgi:antitoxin component YwqK of YwqJK toxin-antitoxin module